MQWGTPLAAYPYLAGVCDPGDYTAANPWTDWSRQFTPGALTTRARAVHGRHRGGVGIRQDRSRCLGPHRGRRGARRRRERQRQRHRDPLRARPARRSRLDQRRQERGRRDPFEVRRPDVRARAPDIDREGAPRRSAADVPVRRHLSQRRARPGDLAQGAGLRGVPGRGRRAGRARPPRRGPAQPRGSRAARRAPTAAPAPISRTDASTGRAGSARSLCGATCSRPTTPRAAPAARSGSRRRGCRRTTTDQPRRRSNTGRSRARAAGTARRPDVDRASSPRRGCPRGRCSCTGTRR